MAFPPLGNSDHVVSVSIDFPSYSQRDALFHCIAYEYSCADWEGLHDDLRDVPWEDIFKLSASAAPSEFCEWVQVGIDVYIPHRKYQVKPHSSQFCEWVQVGIDVYIPHRKYQVKPHSSPCGAAIVHRNHFFPLYQKDKSSESKV